MIDLRWVHVAAYIALWSTQALLIKQSVRELKRDDSSDTQPGYPYEVLSMIILVEAFKLGIALAAYFCTNHEWSGGPTSKSKVLVANFAQGTSLIVAAIIYAAYNGLSFTCLRLLEPGTIRVLINARVIFSGALLHFLFGQQLSARQWVSLALLCAACAVEQSGSFRIEGGVVALALVLLQGFCSSLGGVYFQWLLKRNYSLGIWPKNIYLYFWSIVVYFLAICSFRPELLSPAAFLHDVDLKAAQIIIVAGLGGIFTALLLRHLSVIVKEYANFAEMVVVAIAQNVLFQTPLRPTLFVAIVLVTISLIMYNSAGSSRSKTGDKQIELSPARLSIWKDRSYLPVLNKQ